MHGVLVNRLGGLRLPRKSVVRLSDRPDMTLDVYRGRKTTIQQQQYNYKTSGLEKKFSPFCFIKNQIFEISTDFSPYFLVIFISPSF